MFEVLFASTTRVLSFFYLIMSGLGVIKAACEKDAETEKNRISIFLMPKQAPSLNEQPSTKCTASLKKTS